jgi:hypothetical protein
MTLGTVLMIVALLATVGMALAGGMLSHHFALSRDTQRDAARNLGRSVVGLAIEKVVENPTLGQNGPSTPLQVQLPGELSDSVGLLTFDPDQARQLRIPLSLNNLEKPQSVLDHRGQPVPPNAVRLFGVGRCRGVDQVVEVTLVVPPFPWALAAAGNLRGEEGLEVGALPNMPTTQDPNQRLLPADLASNGDVFLGRNSQIEGDVRAAGQVEFDPSQPDSVRVRGEVLTQASPIRLAELQMAAFDPQSRGVSSTPLLDAEFSTPEALVGAYRRAGPLHVTGNLKLDGGLLYVQGDLVVDGGFEGKGMIVTTGKLEMRGQGQFEGTNAMALLSGGDMELHGQGKLQSRVNGLVYSKGNFRAESLSVYGTVASLGEAVFRDSRMVGIPGTDKYGGQRTPPGSAGEQDEFSVYEIPLGSGSGLSLTPAINVASPRKYIVRFGVQVDRTQSQQTVTYRIFDGNGQPIPGHPQVEGVNKREFPGLLTSLTTYPNSDNFTTWVNQQLDGPTIYNKMVAVAPSLEVVIGDPGGGGDDDEPPVIPPVDLSQVYQLHEQIRMCQWKETQ